MEMKMDYATISPGRRRFLNIDGDVVNSKCIKRRRRDPLGVALSSSDQQHGDNQQQQQTQGSHQTAPPTATTVKRSSRFRGVSRFADGFYLVFVLGPCDETFCIRNVVFI